MKHSLVFTVGLSRVKSRTLPLSYRVSFNSEKTLAEDQELFSHAKMVQARASRRFGELLQQIDGRPQNATKQI